MKRVAKFLGIITLGMFVLLTAAVIYVRVKYPSERLRKMLIAALAEKFHLQAQIESLSFHLFSGFTLKNLAVVAVDQNRATIPAVYQAALQIDEVSLSYRWRSLLARRLDIDVVTISHPRISYWQAADSTTNLDALFAALHDTAMAQSDTTAANLPFDINLQTMQLHDVHISTGIAARADTQYFALGPLDLAIDSLRLARDANYRADFKLAASSAKINYRQTAHDSGVAVNYAGLVQANIEGRSNVDSIITRARLTLKQNRLQWGNNAEQTLPSLQTEAEATYQFDAARLHVPRFTLRLDEHEMLTLRYDMQAQDSTSAFEMYVTRGRLDCAYLTQLAHALKFDFLPPTLAAINLTGALDFSGTTLRQTSEALQYKIILQGENIGYKDTALGLGVDSTQIQFTMYNFLDDKPTESMTFDAELDVAALHLPLDATIMHTGPLMLRTEGRLAADYSLQNLSWNLDWRNVSDGLLQSIGSFDKPARGSSFSLKANIAAEAIELAPVTSDTLQGRITANLNLAGTRWEDLQITCALLHDSLRYLLEEDAMRFPPYQWSLSSRLKINPNFTDWLFAPGTLRGAPLTANFTARYQTEPGTFRFDLIEASLDLSHILGMLPPSYLEGLNPRLAGLSTAKGWMNFQFSSVGAMEYTGKFEIDSDKAMFTDDSLGIYADWLELKSVWDLATAKTTGNYAVTLLAAAMPDYIKLPLPRTIASGKLEVDEQSFIIKDAKFEAPAWHMTGDYRVDGKFLRDGMQVMTSVNANMNAPEAVTVDRGVTLQGNLKTRMVIDQFLPDDVTAPQPASINATLHTEHLNVTLDTTVTITDMNADLFYSQAFDLLSLNLIPPKESQHVVFANAAEALLLFDVLGELPENRFTANSQLRIAKLQMREYEFSDIVAKLNLGQSRFDIPQLRMNVLGGNVIGNVLVGLGEGKPEDLTYSIALQISSLDVSRLRRLRAQVEQGAKLSADFYLNGKGAAPGQLDEVLNNLAGKLNITKIEKKTATNLLEALDPNGTDAGIQRVRFLLKTGWNVKYMTFEIKNGFIYASLAPVKTKPWSALFNLPTTLDFARLPVRYFMTEE